MEPTSPICPICRNELTSLCIECDAGTRLLGSNPANEVDSLDRPSGRSRESTAGTRIKNLKIDPLKCTTKRCYWSTQHAYHTHCIDRWLKVHSVCPLDNCDWKTMPPEGLTLKELCLRTISGHVDLIFEFYQTFKDDLGTIPPSQIELLEQLVTHSGHTFRGMDKIPKSFRRMLGAPFLEYIPEWKQKEIVKKATSPAEK